MMAGLRERILSWFGIGAVPDVQHDATHDEDVHRIRNEATITYGAFDRDMRNARKWAHGQDLAGELERQIAETRAATEAVRRFVAAHHDPDDGLLRGMDRRLQKDGER